MEAVAVFGLRNFDQHYPRIDVYFDEEDLLDEADREPLASQSCDSDAAYVCDSCGEEIVVPIDVTQGQSQEYVEDCPVCCNPNVIHVSIDFDGVANVWGRAEQDRH